MSESIRTLLFSVVLCLICGTLLTAASSGLKEIQQKNMTIDQRKNILQSVGLVKTDRQYTGDEINRTFEQKISRLVVDQTGSVIPSSETGGAKSETELPIYLYTNEDKQVEAYVIPIDTRGLWGKIYGYLALKSDGATISGFTIYKHSETPGLGGEIEQNWFQRNFVGKKIIGPEGEFVSIAVAKGKADDSVPKDRRPNYVDGISGATLTGKFLTQGLKEILTSYEGVSVTFRNTKEYCKTNKETPWCRK
ncbi:MAG: FMN-binding protein [Desulfobacteraceae bacterium]|nr:MAG: FMN-binding protein [Desulfobacteraceae bacterium]